MRRSLTGRLGMGEEEELSLNDKEEEKEVLSLNDTDGVEEELSLNDKDDEEYIINDELE